MSFVIEAWQEFPTAVKVKVTEPAAKSELDGVYTIPFKEVGFAIVPAVPLDDHATLA